MLSSTTMLLVTTVTTVTIKVPIEDYCISYY